MEPKNPDILSAKKITFDKRFFSQGSQQGLCKKLKIKNLVSPPKRENILEENWTKIEDGIENFLVLAEPGEKFPSNQKYPYTILYNCVQEICDDSIADAGVVHSRLRTKVQKFVDDVIMKKLVEILEESDSEFLRIVNHVWEHYSAVSTTLRLVFLYLDRVYVLPNPQLCSLLDMFVEIFRSHVIKYEKFTKKLITSLLNLIDIDRKEHGKDVLTHDLVKNTVRLLLDVAIYKDLFEREFLEKSRTHFASDARKRFHQMGSINYELAMVDSYIRHIDASLQEENERITRFGLEQHSTGKSVIQILEQELIEKNLSTLLSAKIFDPLYDDVANCEVLKLAHTLLCRIEKGEQQLCTSFGKYIRSKGRIIVQMSYSTNEKENCLIKDLLRLIQRMEKFLLESFRNRLFHQEMRSSFKAFINMRTSKIPVLLAEFVNSAFANIAQTGEAGFEEIVNNALALVDLTYSKEIFEAFYQRDLAKRLLSGQSYSMSAEKMFVDKMNNLQTDPSFITRVEGMFKDMDHSKELSSSLAGHFRGLSLEEKPVVEIDMAVSMLTKAHWPTYQKLEFNQPKEFQIYQKMFTDFYSIKHRNRKLAWQPAFSYCIVKAEFNCGVKELQASYLQTLVVLLFNDHESLTFQDIASKLLVQDTAKKGAEEGELRMTLQSLVFGEYPLLKKEPNPWEIAQEDVFSLNENFQTSEYQIKMNQIQWKEMEEKNTEINQKAGDIRCTVLDCTIVRIMKQKKTSTRKDLLAEIYQKIDFAASSTEIKARVELLIERYFLSKDTRNPEILHYVT